MAIYNKKYHLVYNAKTGLMHIHKATKLMLC